MAKYLGYRPQGSDGDFKAVWNIEKYNDILLGKDWLDDFGPKFLTNSDLGGAQEQSAFSNTVTAIAAEGRTKKITYSVVSGMPNGLTLNSNTGVISGTFTGDIKRTNRYDVVIRATGAANNYVDKTFTIKEIAQREAAGYVVKDRLGRPEPLADSLLYKPDGYDEVSISVSGCASGNDGAPVSGVSHVDITKGVHDIDLHVRSHGMGGGAGGRQADRKDGWYGGNGVGVGTLELWDDRLLIGSGGVGGRGHPQRFGLNHFSDNGPTTTTREGAPGQGTPFRGSAPPGGAGGGGGGGVSPDGGRTGGGGGGGSMGRPWDGYSPGEPGSSMINDGPVPQTNIGNPKVSAIWRNNESKLNSRNGPIAPSAARPQVPGSSENSTGWLKVSWG